jgi:hypothetical protein
MVMGNRPRFSTLKHGAMLHSSGFLLHGKPTSPYPLGDQRDLTTVGFVESLLLINVTTSLTQCVQSLSFLWLIAADIRREFFSLLSLAIYTASERHAPVLSSLVFYAQPVDGACVPPKVRVVPVVACAHTSPPPHA